LRGEAEDPEAISGRGPKGSSGGGRKVNSGNDRRENSGRGPKGRSGILQKDPYVRPGISRNGSSDRGPVGTSVIVPNVYSGTALEVNSDRDPKENSGRGRMIGLLLGRVTGAGADTAEGTFAGDRKSGSGMFGGWFLGVFSAFTVVALYLDRIWLHIRKKRKHSTT